MTGFKLQERFKGRGSSIMDVNIELVELAEKLFYPALFTEISSDCAALGS